MSSFTLPIMQSLVCMYVIKFMFAQNLTVYCLDCPKGDMKMYLCARENLTDFS